MTTHGFDSSLGVLRHIAEMKNIDKTDEIVEIIEESKNFAAFISFKKIFILIS